MILRLSLVVYPGTFFLNSCSLTFFDASCTIEVTHARLVASPSVVCPLFLKSRNNIMPTKGTRSRRRTSVRQTQTVRPSRHQQDRSFYVVLIILALCLLGWIISRVPTQVW